MLSMFIYMVSGAKEPQDIQRTCSRKGTPSLKVS